MSIRADLRSYLLSKSSITTLVGSRIYPQEAPQGAVYPRIIYQETGGERDRTLDGANRLTKTSFDLTAQSQDGDNAKAISDALANVLDVYQGQMARTTVQGVFVTANSDNLIPPDGADEKSVKESSISIDLWYESAVPTYS